MYKDTSIAGDLEVGKDDIMHNTTIEKYIQIHNSYQGYTGYGRIYLWRDYVLIFNIVTNRSTARMLFRLKEITFMYLSCDSNNIQFYKPTTNALDDRLKENEELIENACETLSKLKPQLYDKKPDIDNDDPTVWYKESGIIAQEIYYDAPELRHLVHRGSPELDEDGNSIPLPEIPTSIDPQHDPDYSSWGKDPASVSYIGLTA